MAEEKAARARRRSTGPRKNGNPEPKPSTTEPQDKPSPRAAAPGDLLAEAQRQHVDGVNQASASLQEDLGGIYRHWVASQYMEQAHFQEHRDADRLEQALQGANAAYWDAVRDASESASQRLREAYQGYLGVIQDTVAALDVKAVDAETLVALAQGLQTAAAFVAGQQQQQQLREQQECLQQQQQRKEPVAAAA